MRRLRINVTRAEMGKIRLGAQQVELHRELVAMRAAEGEPEDVFWDALRSVLGRELVGRLPTRRDGGRGLDSVDLHVNEERLSIAESERLEILED